jgi:hypothetical protein
MVSKEDEKRRRREAVDAELARRATQPFSVKPFSVLAVRSAPPRLPGFRLCPQYPQGSGADVPPAGGRDGRPTEQRAGQRGGDIETAAG